MIQFITHDHWIEDITFNTRLPKTALEYRKSFRIDIFMHDHLHVGIL